MLRPAAGGRYREGNCPTGQKGRRKGRPGRGVRVTEDQSGGGLPSAAQARMAQIRSSGTWGSALSADEFAAIRSVGFEPVGQVFGASVYSVGDVAYSCPGTWGSRREVTPAQATEVSGQGDSGSFGPL